MTKWLISSTLVLLGLLPAAPAQTYTPINNPRVTFVDASGVPCAGCLLYTYQAGTTTPQATYSNNTGTQNTNPITLDVAGGATIFFSSANAYKLVLQTALGSTIWTQDNIVSVGQLINQGLANYLPLTGGTLTGPLIGTSITGSSITSTGSINGVSITASGALNGQTIATTEIASQFTGADCGAKINAADTALGANQGVIQVDLSCGTAWTTQVTLNSGHSLRIVQSGTYVLSNTLLYGSNLEITSTGGATLQLATGVGGGQGLTLLQPITAGTTNVTIHNLTLDQRGDIYTGIPTGTVVAISLLSTTNVRVHDVTFKRIIFIAVWADSPNATCMTDAQIYHNYVVNSNAGGFSLFGCERGTHITDNIIENTMDDAIALQDSTNGSPSDIHVSNNYVWHANVRGVNNSTPGGVRFLGVLGGDITNNVFNATVNPCIQVTDGNLNRSSNITITGNTMQNCGVTSSSTTGVNGMGMLVINTDKLTLSGNTVSASRLDGIYVKTSTSVTVGPNTSTMNGGAGLVMESITNGAVSGGSYIDNGNQSGYDQYGMLVIGGTNVSVSSAGFTEDRSGGARTQTYGLFGTSTPGVVAILGDVFSGNTTAAIGGGIPTTGIKRYNNVGDTGYGSISQRFGATCATAASAGATCGSTFSWTTAFADGAYTPVCVGVGATGSPIFSVSSFTSTGVTISVQSATGAASSYTGVYCTATHD